jgi:transcriptional regulator with XRE-family HTH domain
MPKIDDHPLRLARVRAGMGQKKLADVIGVHRSTIAAIEEGRTNDPEPETVAAIESALQLPSGTFGRQLVLWRRHRSNVAPVVGGVGRAVLAAGPNHVAGYGSFVEWRARFSSSPTAFASLLGVNRAVVANYERGLRVFGMPEVLQHALISRLGVSNEYIVALCALPPRLELPGE